MKQLPLLLLISLSTLQAQSTTSTTSTPSTTSTASTETAARAEPVDSREVVTRLQIFLDQQNFGPGIIDGRWGEFKIGRASCRERV